MKKIGEVSSFSGEELLLVAKQCFSGPKFISRLAIGCPGILNGLDKGNKVNYTIYQMAKYVVPRLRQK